MDAGLLELIGTYGFPIAVTVYLLWERRQRDNEKSNKVAVAVENNTKVMISVQELMRDCKSKVYG